MTILKPETLCVIVGGCPENIGMIVAVIRHLGRHGSKPDAYHVRTVSGRHFHQLWKGGALICGDCDNCITDRHKLRPLVELGAIAKNTCREAAIEVSDTDNKSRHSTSVLG